MSRLLQQQLQLPIDSRSATRISQLQGNVNTLGRTNFTTTIDNKDFNLSALVLPNFRYPLLIGLDSGDVLNLTAQLRQRIAVRQPEPAQISHPEAECNTTCDSGITTHGPLTASQQAQVNSLLKRFDHLFAKDRDDVGRIPGLSHYIEMRTARPIFTKPHRMSRTKSDTIRGIVRDLLKKGFIRKSNSPYSSPTTLAYKKTTGDPRLCFDFRRLNHETVDDRHPLPNIKSVIDRTHGSRFFTTLDIAWGYWHVALDPRSVPLTAFSTEDGHFEWLVMPFGLKNAPATYQRAIRLILGDAAYVYAMNYLDDILIHDSRFADHLVHLEDILTKLSAHNIKLRKEKCRFVSDEVEYLGMIIKDDTIRPKPETLEAITAFPEPRTKKEVQRFLGLCNWIRDFIPGFTEIAAPLQAMTGSKAGNRCLRPAERESFIKLKEKLTSDPILTVYDPEREVEIHCDASDIGIGAILVQRTADREPRVIAYHSRKLSLQQEAWPTQDKEGFAVVDAIKQFDPYLSIPFKVFTDNSSLQWIHSKEKLPARIHRWFIRISPYTFTIHHRKGSENQHADALSRAPVGSPIPDEFLQRGKITDLRSETRDSRTAARSPVDEPQTLLSASNPLPLSVIRDVQGKDMYDDIRNGTTVNGLTCVNIRGESRIVLPRSLVRTALRFYHDQHGHPGRSKTSRLVSLYYWWPSITADIAEYVKTCDSCQRVKATPGPRLGDLQLMPCPELPMEILAMDTIVVGSSANNTAAKYIQVVIDHNSRYVWATATKTNTASAAITALNNALRTAGRASSLLTDNGSNFTSKAFRTFLKSQSIAHLRSTAYHPETNGMVERVNGVLTVRIRLKLDEKPNRKWSSLLTEAVQEYNATPHETTGFTPNFLLLGLPPGGPRPANLPPLDEARRVAAQRTRAKQLKNKDAFDAHHIGTTLEIGSRVVKRIPTNHPDLKKFSPRNAGPFVVMRQLGPVTYKLGRSDDDPYPFAAHVSQLMAYADRDSIDRLSAVQIEGGECDGPRSAPQSSRPVS